MSMRRNLTAIVACVAAALLVPAASQAAPASASDALTWSFENDAVGTVPAGCTTPYGRAPAAVSSDTAHSGTHSLRLADDSAASFPGIACARPAGRGANLTFAVDPAAAPCGFALDLLGTTTAGTHGVVFHLWFHGDGPVQYYDDYEWLPVAPSGGPPVGQWSTIQLATTADQDMAYVRVNGQLIGSAGPWGWNPIVSIDGFQFTGCGTPQVGDHVYLDDVSMGPALDQRPPEITSAYHIGRLTTIATSRTPVQMPNTAVQVPLPDGGWRILMSYPTHTDAVDTTGNEFVYSDDRGQTWHDYQAHNPMPDAPSYNMTLLADGSLFAINYHGYVAPKPNQSVIETAVSTDNGATWTRRDGLLTAPQNFARIACERPSGCSYFVQVHNVLQDAHGTMYQSGYGMFAGDTKDRQAILVSHDGGINWTLRATVAYSTTPPPGYPDRSYNGFVEGAMTRAGDGSLLIVMRTGSWLPMYISRSADDGRTWSAPKQMRTVSGRPVLSVYPTIDRLADGSLVMLVGRPGYSLLRSWDDGRTWSDQANIDYQDSENGYMLPLGGQSVMIFGDRGANWQHPLQYGVWCRAVDVAGRRFSYATAGAGGAHS